MSGRQLSDVRLGIVGVLFFLLLIAANTAADFNAARAQTQDYNTPFLTDAQLVDYNAMSEDEIRAFLSSQNSYFAQIINDVDGMEFDPAKVIAAAAAEYQINPQVILTTLQKESSGVSQNSRPSDAGLAFLMGCGSPSTAREQLACAAQYFRAYYDELEQNGVTRSGWQVGVARNTQDKVPVTPANKAVAGQFTYTPYAGTNWGGEQICGNGTGPCGGVYLFYTAWNSFGFGISNNAGSQPPVDPILSSNTSTIFVTDVSGSMDESWQDGIKIESAKEAALQLTDLLERESQISNATHEAALVTFTSSADNPVPLTSDFTTLKNGISALAAISGTNMGRGLELANQVASTTSSQAQKIIILLSDGLSNEGMNSDMIVAGPAREAGQAGACIYAIGFGDPGNLDEDLLRRIVAEGKTGCSEYFYAADKFNLENIYIQSRHDATGDIIGKFSGQIAQDEVKQIGTFIVPPGQGELHSSLDWPGSELELVLTDPGGTPVTATYPGATLSTYSDLAYWIIKNPVVGEWGAAAVGVDVPEGILDYESITSVRAATQLPGDWDGDGVCTESDALAALQMAVGLRDSANILDINSDSRVTEADALAILKWAVSGGTCGP